MEKSTPSPSPTSRFRPGTPAYLVLDARANASFAAAFALLKDKAEIFRSKEKIAGAGFEAAPGSFIVTNGPAVKKTLPGLLEKLHLKAYPSGRRGLDSKVRPQKSAHRALPILVGQYGRRLDALRLRRPRHSLRHHPHRRLQGPEAAAGAKAKVPTAAASTVTVDLKAKYDVIVFAGEDYDLIKTGKIDPASPWARWFAPLPPEYEGGLEKEGIDNLKAFVEKGGILVTLNDACKLAIKEFEPPARNILEKVDPSKFFCPMSILKLTRRQHDTPSDMDCRK